MINHSTTFFNLSTIISLSMLLYFTSSLEIAFKRIKKYSILRLIYLDFADQHTSIFVVMIIFIKKNTAFHWIIEKFKNSDFFEFIVNLYPSFIYNVLSLQSSWFSFPQENHHQRHIILTMLMAINAAKIFYHYLRGQVSLNGTCLHILFPKKCSTYTVFISDEKRGHIS